MQLEIGATYQPHEDEVWVDFRSTEDDLTTVTVADSLELQLLIESVDLIGTASFIPLSIPLKISGDYVRPDRNFEAVIRNPERKMDLWVETKATFGSDIYTKRVKVGEALDSHSSMALPDNVLFEKDVLAELETGGGEVARLPNENVLVLAPELQNFVRAYDFTVSLPEEDYSGITYQGGGNRLLINNQSDQFELQNVNVAPWTMPGFAFMEPASENIIPNGFFLNTTTTGNTLPTGWSATSPTGALFQSTVDFDYKVSASAKIWAMRVNRQASGSMNYTELVMKTNDAFPVEEESTYTFSVYTRVRALTPQTKVTKLKLEMEWLLGETVVLVNELEMDARDFQAMDLATFTATAPTNVNRLRTRVRLGSIDQGDDVEISFLGWQVEPGTLPTTRMAGGERENDRIIIPDYNALNQKIRMQMIMGFPSGVDMRQLVGGPIDVFFHTSGVIEARVVGVASVTASLAFQPGESLDLTVEHQVGKRIALIRDGQLLAEEPLPQFAAAPGPLTIFGVGVELMKLSVFSRRGV